MGPHFMAIELKLWLTAGFRSNPGFPIFRPIWDTVGAILIKWTCTPNSSVHGDTTLHPLYTGYTLGTHHPRWWLFATRTPIKLNRQLRIILRNLPYICVYTYKYTHVVKTLLTKWLGDFAKPGYNSFSSSPRQIAPL